MIEAMLSHRFEGGDRELFIPLADLARRSGRIAAARALVETGLAEFPERVSGWVLAGRIEMQAGNVDRARHYYRQVLEELDPGNLPALRSLTLGAIEAGKFDEAKLYLERWCREDPDDPEAEDMLAEMNASPQTEGEDRPLPGAKLVGALGLSSAYGDGDGSEGGGKTDA